MTEKVQNICKILSGKMAQDIRIVDINAVSSLADYFVIASGNSVSQVKSLAKAVDEQMEKLGYNYTRVEGASEGRWVAMDYGDVIIHIFYKETRAIYALDTLWNNGNNVEKYED